MPLDDDDARALPSDDRRALDGLALACCCGGGLGCRWLDSAEWRDALAFPPLAEGADGPAPSDDRASPSERPAFSMPGPAQGGRLREQPERPNPQGSARLQCNTRSKTYFIESPQYHDNPTVESSMKDVIHERESREALERDRRLLTLIHLVGTPAWDSRKGQPRPRLQTSSSAPTLRLSCMPTPAHVRKALAGSLINAEALRPARKAPVPPTQSHRRAPSFHRVAPRWRPPPTKAVSLYHEMGGAKHERTAPPPPAPMDRHYSRGVERRLQQIQGTAKTPLRDRFFENPGAVNMPGSRQLELHALLSAGNPRTHNYGNARSLGDESIRHVVSALGLREGSAFKVQMNIYERELQLSELLTRLRGASSAQNKAP